MNILKNNYNKNIAISIVLYNAPENIIKRILNVADLNFKIFIFDNSKIAINDFNFIKSISYKHSTKNVGLSGGIKYNIDCALNLGYFGLLNFDQDTVFTTRTLDFINNIFYLQKTQNIFNQKIISLCFRDLSPIKKSNYIYINNKKINFVKTNFSINSGSLYFLEFYSYFDWFDSNFFVDGLDYNFCLNAKLNNFEILQVYNTIDLDHQTEQDDNIISIFGIKFKGRIYGRTRNKDFIQSHLFLIYNCLINFKVDYLFFIFNLNLLKNLYIKSLVIYILSQLLFRLKKYFNKYLFNL